MGANSLLEEKEKSWRCLDLERRRGSSAITPDTEADHIRLCGSIVYSQCSGEKINHRCQTAGGGNIPNLQKEGFSRMGAGRKMLTLLEHEAVRWLTKAKKKEYVSQH